VGIDVAPAEPPIYLVLASDRRGISSNMPLIAPNMRNLRRNFAKNPQAPALWNPSPSTIEEAQYGLRFRLLL
jgi:hypothetical protein